jgi:hypothetical protein
MIMEDQWALHTLKKVLTLEFQCYPGVNIKETRAPRHGIHESVILEEINVLFEKHVDYNQEDMGYYSTIFVVPKKQGGFRTILNLIKPLNQTIVPCHFKMESLQIIMIAMKKKKRKFRNFIGSERCLFQYSNTHRLPEISEIPVSWPGLPICGNAFRTSLDSKSL